MAKREEVSALLELALHETLLKEAPLFIQYVEKLPEFKSEKSLMASLEQYQSQIQDPARFGERITAAQISFFIHENKGKLLPAFISYDIVEKTKRGAWPTAIITMPNLLAWAGGDKYRGDQRA